MAGSGAGEFPYPIIADAKRDLAIRLGMLDADERDSTGMPAAARAVFIIGPDKKLKLSILYPATTGRNFDEILRVIDSLQLTANYRVATPANWKQGGDVMVTPAVKPEEIPQLFPKVGQIVRPISVVTDCSHVAQGVDVKKVPSGKSYLRYTPQPNI